MTTTVKITTHDWPVKVEQIDVRGERDETVETFEVPAHSERTIYLTSSRHFHITELPRRAPNTDPAAEQDEKDQSAGSGGY